MRSSKRNKTSTNVLYLGMADDVVTPFMLVPNVDVLFIIDRFDPAFSKDRTSEGQKADIKDILTRGSDKFSHTRIVDINAKYYEQHGRIPSQTELDLLLTDTRTYPINYLNGPSVITNESDQHNVWRLTVMYNSKIRQIVSYRERDFYDDWPSEITAVRHIIGNGAFSLFDERIESERRMRCIQSMQTRTTPTWTYYELYYEEVNFPTRHSGRNSSSGIEEIVSVVIDNADGLLNEVVEKYY